MTLNKQKILNELGSVMSQLESANCGCMEKLFSNTNQNDQAPTGPPLPTWGGFRRGCWHGHGYSHPYNNGVAGAGEPYSVHHLMHSPNMSRPPCMGQCNPQKLYAGNHIQPVVQEVHSDLKSITSDNTVMNNPLPNQMGLTHGNVAKPSNPNTNMAQNSGNTSTGYVENTQGMNKTGTEHNLQFQGGTFSQSKLNVNRANVNTTLPVEKVGATLPVEKVGAALPMEKVGATFPMEKVGATLPVEKVGGDTLVKNQVRGDETAKKVELVMGQIGDVPASKPQGESEIVKPTSIPARQAKCRNGLQDMVYTSYPSSAAWSFHGRQEFRPFPTGYRYNK